MSLPLMVVNTLLFTIIYCLTVLVAYWIRWESSTLFYVIIAMMERYNKLKRKYMSMGIPAYDNTYIFVGVLVIAFLVTSKHY